jgi:hypothetical protein
MSQKAVAAEAEIQNEQKTAPTILELEQGIADRLERIEEFRFIEEEATKLGVKAYLFGGTAAGYAHYVKWDLQREKGDKRFQKDRFDYDYTNIFRSTQDLDIVIDGNPEQANKLQQALQQKYPHLQGNKTAWEVRLLTQDMGDKQAILNNPDFMNQHTDSNSTGMIEITKPKNGEHVVKDIRDWHSKEPYFLKDVHDGMLHYYFSPLHETTKFAKEGRNPPILSAIRFLTKAFQYELKIRPEDLAQIKKVIQEFDPKETAKNNYVAKWIEKNGKKLIQNAVNIEYAKNTLDQLGLREKLQSIKGDVSTADSLAWWMNKEPLRTQSVGQGLGKTAKELGIDIVAHETNNFLAYESITRAHTGDPNVLISRQNAPGEAAAYGDGFYTKTGKEGARGTGLTIRFHLNPDAREGSDFTYEPGHDYVVVKNKAALKVIPESLNIGPLEYFKMLADGGELGLQKSDRGIIEKFKRRIGIKIQAFTKPQIKEIVQIVQAQIENSPEPEKLLVVQEWLSFPASTHYPHVIDSLLNRQSKATDQWLAQSIFSQPMWKDHPEWVERLVERRSADSNILRYILIRPEWANRPDLVEKILQRKDTADYNMMTKLLSQPHWKDYPQWLEQVIESASSAYWVVGPLSKSHWKNHPEFVLKLMEKHSGILNAQEIAMKVFSTPTWADHPELVEALIERNPTVIDYIARYVLSQPHWAGHPELVERLLKMGTADKAIAESVLSKDHWKDHPELVEMLLQKGTQDNAIAKEVLSKPHWKNHPELRRLAGGQEPTIDNLRAAFARGERVHMTPKTCIVQHLNQSLH